MASASHALEAVFVRILDVSWQAAVLVLLIMAVQWLLQERLGARFRHALWVLLFVRLALPRTVPSPFSVYSLVRETLGLFGVQWAIPSLPESGFSAQPLPMRGLAGAAPQYALPFSWWQVGASIWLIGVLCVIGVALLQASRLRKRVREEHRLASSSVLDLLEECKQRMRVSARIDVLESPHVDGPALLGFLRPRLLLPRTLLDSASPDELRYVFLHELAHLKRRDILTGWLAYVLMAVHWFNPVLWWARRRHAADRELACDACVLSALERDERRAYGHAILDQYERSRSFVWSPGLAGVLDGNTNIERRITMINRFKTPSRVGTLLAMTAMALLGAAVLTDAKEEPGSPSEPSAYFLALPESGAQPVAVPITEQQAPPKENAGAVSEKAPPDAVGIIGVYDKGLILKSWKKAKESYAKLQAEVNEKQKGIDTLSETVQKEKDDYDKAKPGLSSAERDAREAKITSMFQDYKATLAKEQADIDTKEQALMKDRLPELEKAAASVGAELGCVEVLQIGHENRTSPAGRALDEKLAKRETVDITSRVLQVLNKE